MQRQNREYFEKTNWNRKYPAISTHFLRTYVWVRVCVHTSEIIHIFTSDNCDMQTCVCVFFCSCAAKAKQPTPCACVRKPPSFRWCDNPNVICISNIGGPRFMRQSRVTTIREKHAGRSDGWLVFEGWQGVGVRVNAKGWHPRAQVARWLLLCQTEGIYYGCSSGAATSVNVCYLHAFVADFFFSPVLIEKS